MKIATTLLIQFFAMKLEENLANQASVGSKARSQ